MHSCVARLSLPIVWLCETIARISINDSMLPSVCYTVIYTVRVGLGLVGASLSEPHTSVTALQDTCVCMSVCLSVCVRTRVYVCLSVCLRTYVYVCLSAYVRPYTENFN